VLRGRSLLLPSRNSRLKDSQSKHSILHSSRRLRSILKRTMKTTFSPSTPDLCDVQLSTFSTLFVPDSPTLTYIAYLMPSPKDFGREDTRELLPSPTFFEATTRTPSCSLSLREHFGIDTTEQGELIGLGFGGMEEDSSLGMDRMREAGNREQSCPPRFVPLEVSGSYWEGSEDEGGWDSDDESDDGEEEEDDRFIDLRALRRPITRSTSRSPPNASNISLHRRVVGLAFQSKLDMLRETFGSTRWEDEGYDGLD
jgi:hypothetical protein